MNSYLVRGGEFGLILWFCFCVTIIWGQNANNEQAICKRYNIPEITWTCKRITDCRWAQNIVNSPQEHRCGADKHVVKICCPERTNRPAPTTRPTPTPQPSTVRPSSTAKPTSASKPTTSQRRDYIQIIRKKCVDYAAARFVYKCVGGQIFGQEEVCGDHMDCRQEVESLITGGKDAALKEFPHMALVGFGQDIKQIDWACGGSLISERFVLSAGHCTNPSSITGEVKWVGLGLLYRKDYTTAKLNENIFSVAKAYNHPGYRGPQANHDIALYRLQSAVKFSPYIRPICLHTEYNIPAEDRENTTIVGWGVVQVGSDVSENLQKATVRVLPRDLCAQQYANEPKLKNGFDEKNMICAGDEYSDQDTCTGDSGGPIQINHKEKCMYVQVGVTSIGSTFCGDHTPAIYTRVFAYLEWIQKIVWPNGA